MRPPYVLLLPVATTALLCGLAAAVAAAPKLDSSGGAAVPSAAPPSSAPTGGDTAPAEPQTGAEPEIPTPVRREEPRPPGPQPKARNGALVSTEPEDDAAADEPAEVRHARDTLGGHVILAAKAGLFIPMGSFDETTSQSDRLGVGPLFGGDVGVGVSRTVAFGAYGEIGLPDDQLCSTCKGSSFSVGPFVRYHLAQGVRFDPWLSYGVGFRKTTLGSSSWTGFDFIRFQLGGDFYAWPSLGFGPFADLAVGTFFDATPKLTSHSVNAHFTVGIRVVFDMPGK
jgi:hypothetical protein